MYCGVPLGAALAASIGIVDLVGGWQVVFYVGGVVPLLIVPLLGVYLSESAVFRSIKDTAPGGVVQGLFRQGAALPNAMIMGHLLLYADGGVHPDQLVAQLVDWPGFQRSPGQLGDAGAAIWRGNRHVAAGLGDGSPPGLGTVR
jgi:hypothetical protein